MRTEVTLARLTGIFFRTGNTTFGGGDPTMAVLYSEFVTARGWLTPQAYGLVYALARVTPGTNLLAFCAGAAWKILGWPAAVAGVAVVTLPAAAIVVLLTEGFQLWQGNRFAAAAIEGTLAAAVGMMLSGVWMLLKPHRTLRSAAFAGGAFLLAFGAGLSPIPILALAALAGMAWRR